MPAKINSLSVLRMRAVCSGRVQVKWALIENVLEVSGMPTVHMYCMYMYICR